MKGNLFLLLTAHICLISDTWAATQPSNTYDAPAAKAEKVKDRFNSGEFSMSSFAFTENKGQVYGYDGLPHPEVKFSFQQGATQIFLLEKGIAYQFTKIHYPEGYQEMVRDKGGMQDMEKLQEMQKQIRTETFRMDMTLVGATNNVEISTEGKSADYTNFYNHNVLDVHSYSKVTYHNVYPGIDWVIYTKGKEVKYDFVVKPGADPSLIKMQFNHQEDLKLNADGSFTLKNSLGNVSEKAPVSFQGLGFISTQFVLETNTISFKLGKYDHKSNLTIDPAIEWSTYYTGATDYNSCSTDAFGNVYLAGGTTTTVGIASGGHQNTIGGNSDAYLVKFNSNGVRQWATYYGGDLSEVAYSCATDGLGNVYLSGNTSSTIGIASGGHQNTMGGMGSSDAFLVKFDGNGVRQWGTYYGGAQEDQSFCCTTNAAGNVFLAGYTKSTADIASIGAHQTTLGNFGMWDAFIVAFNSNGVRQWGTYYGGTSNDQGYSCAADGLGNVYLAGIAGSSSGIASGGHQNTIAGGSDAFLVKFNSLGVRQWGTYYGGNVITYGKSCATDGTGNVYLSGVTASTVGIAQGGHQNIFGGTNDAFLVKFNTSGVRQWGTYYGGSQDEWAYNCETDGMGNAYLVGKTQSINGIASGGTQNMFGGVIDAFLVKFNGSGVRQWGSYFGGTGIDIGHACSIDVSGNMYMAGYTSSTVGIAFGGHQNTISGGVNHFLVKFCDAPALTPSIISGSTVVCIGSFQTYSISNTLNASSYIWNLPSGSWSGTSTTNVISTTVGASGILSVTAINACGASPIQTIGILSNPLPSITINSGIICAGASFTLAPSGASTYSYSSGSAVVSPTSNSSYTVTGTDSNGCEASAVSNITVNPLPVILISANQSLICEGEEITLVGSGANSYTWSTGSNSSSITVSPAQTTTYTLTGSDANNCENINSFVLQVDACLGMAQLADGSIHLAVYPNPNTGEFFIETSKAIELSIYNALGQLMKQQWLSEGKHKISLNEEAKGIYFMHVNQNGKTQVTKLIKE